MRRADFLLLARARLERGGPRGSAEPAAAAPPEPARASTSELAARFCAELARVGGSARVCRSAAELEEALAAFLRESGARSLCAFERAAFDAPLFERLAREWPIDLPANDDAGFRARAAATDVGISVADLAIAASGTLLFCARPGRPRSVTLLPRSHVALVRAADVVPDLAAALAHLDGLGAPASSALFVTGPSRTSDIENDLTLGVHGPAAVTAFVQDTGGAHVPA